MTSAGVVGTGLLGQEAGVGVHREKKGGQAVRVACVFACFTLPLAGSKPAARSLAGWSSGIIPHLWINASTCGTSECVCATPGALDTKPGITGTAHRLRRPPSHL